MPLQLNIQVDIVIYSLLAGILTGILFDAYRLIRGYKIPKLIVVVEDLLFWALCALVVFTFLLYTNYAFLGPYVYVFIGIAIAFYIKFISPHILKTERVIGRKFSKSLRVSAKNFIYPFKIFMSKMGNKNK
ncbi:MAG: spore cortex biosynthesis protein YabQ [Clostridium sp.]|uniref:Spore cortex protein YabQ (Spore_YabQ) n=1 Tax=Clostridium paraputrificum TaxID=29363 RepID=A0A6N2Y8B6_9CLOT|nr:spore cortex biosynthesis protein YabQ [Clostridium sp.]MBS5928128.1 spore cortex biosynthesis protein YabQ [Clostridium sp.]MBS5987249.1 spore cortex biosynthesis protein YabQ [Clostridium sp.]